MSSLLPPNSSALEKDLEQIIERSSDLPVAIKTLWDPWACPSALLPWLAWANSVDDWQESWPEQVKRQVIDASFDVHRYKGTPHAVQRALDSLGISTDIKEWWEDGGTGQRGTMKVTALVNDNISNGQGLINAQTLQLITRAINNSKRGSIHFDVELGIALREAIALAAATAKGTGITDAAPSANPVLPDAAATQFAAAAVEHRLDCRDHDVNIIPPANDEAKVSACAIGACYQIQLNDHVLTGVN